MSELEGAIALEAQRAEKRKRPIIGWLYRMKDWTESLADKRYAVPALFLLAVAESSFFPIPPDVLLIAMCVGRPKRSLYYALVCAVGSIIGGIIGYGIGYALWYDVATGQYTALAQFFFGHIPGFREDRFESVRGLYDQYNFWIVFIAGFTPIPYKIFTIAGGVFKVNFLMFAFASLIGRAGRFFLVGGLFYYFGAAIRDLLEKYLEILTVLFVILLIGGFALIKWAL